MAAPQLKYAIGNSASTTLSSSVSDSDTSFPLTSDTNFAAKSGEGMALMDEGEVTEELGYSTGKTGSSLTIPLANRGLEGGSAQGHASSASVKGIFTVGMWNDLIDALVDNLLDQSAGTLKIQGTATVTDVLDEDTMSSDSETALATQQSIKAYVDSQFSSTVAFRATMSGSQGDSATPAKVVFDTETFDTGTNYDPTTNYRFTAPSTGYYQINAGIDFSSLSAGDDATIYIYVDGSAYSSAQRDNVAAGGDGLQISDVVYLTASQYVEIYHSNSGGAATINGSNGCFFSGFKI